MCIIDAYSCFLFIQHQWTVDIIDCGVIGVIDAMMNIVFAVTQDMIIVNTIAAVRYAYIAS